jgi:hypothetical protein
VQGGEPGLSGGPSRGGDADRGLNAQAAEAIAECIRSRGVGEAESSIKFLSLVPASTAADRDALLAVESVKL